MSGLGNVGPNIARASARGGTCVVSGNLLPIPTLKTGMRAPTPTLPSGLPGRTAIAIIGCLVAALAALWFYILTGNMIAIGVGALALVIAGVCASTYRWVE